MIYGIKNPIKKYNKSRHACSTSASYHNVSGKYVGTRSLRTPERAAGTHTIHALTRTHLGFMSDAPADLDFPLRDSPVHRSPIVQIPL